MEGPSVPGSTLRVLASILVLAFDLVRLKAVDAVTRIKPLVEPPGDLRVTSRVGALYSGVLVIDRGEIIAGVVVQTGQGLPSPALLTTPPTSAPSSSSSSYAGDSSSYAGPSSSGRLPGWADDPRDLYEDEPWRRR